MFHMITKVYIVWHIAVVNYSNVFASASLFVFNTTFSQTKIPYTHAVNLKHDVWIRLFLSYYVNQSLFIYFFPLFSFDCVSVLVSAIATAHYATTLFYLNVSCC